MLICVTHIEDKNQDSSSERSVAKTTKSGSMFAFRWMWFARVGPQCVVRLKFVEIELLTGDRLSDDI